MNYLPVIRIFYYGHKNYRKELCKGIDILHDYMRDPVNNYIFVKDMHRVHSVNISTLEQFNIKKKTQLIMINHKTKEIINYDISPNIDELL